jgi:Ca2+-binding RTX toxin-like protein
LQGIVNIRRLLALMVTGLVIGALVGAAAPQASARQCFGKQVNRVVSGDNRTVKLKFKDVVWVSGKRVTVIGKPYSTICAGAGPQTIRAGKGRSRTDAGPGNDRIFIAKSSLSIARGGLGNDLIVGSKGHDFIYGSPKRVPARASDRDTIRGMGGNDRIFDYGGQGNLLFGLTGVDRIRSLGRAVSSLYGGNGSDFLYSDGGRSASGRSERLFGERGNDRLNANLPGSDGPAFLDGGTGDDWLDGTSFGDTVVVHSGIVKINTGAGDDLIVATSAGRVSVDGGSGNDSISWATHTPSEQRSFSGVEVNLAGGSVGGVGVQKLSSVENVIGSSFDDTIVGRPGTTNRIIGGLGDDVLIGQRNDGDIADGGPGLNDCSGFVADLFCGRSSPGNTGNSRVLVDMNASGVLTVMGTGGGDQVRLGYDSGNGRYLVSTGEVPLASGLCELPDKGSTTAVCRAGINNLNGALIYGGDGPDSISVADSVPPFVTTTIDGGSGQNVLTGGRTKDVISTESNSAGSVLRGRGNLDRIYVPGRGKAFGGPGPDLIQGRYVCLGGTASGGPGSDNLVFAGADRGVKADLGRGYARYLSGPCGRPLSIATDVESLEGSRFNDVLILGRKHRAQDRKRSLLGREGIDVLNSRNGFSDSVTTGSGGRRNKVIADRGDTVIWGWGFSGY